VRIEETAGGRGSDRKDWREVLKSWKMGEAGSLLWLDVVRVREGRNLGDRGGHWGRTIALQAQCRWMGALMPELLCTEGAGP
jgi:hypothetical protein